MKFTAAQIASLIEGTVDGDSNIEVFKLSKICFTRLSFLKYLIDEELSTSTESFVFWGNNTFSGIVGFISNSIIKNIARERIIAKTKFILVGCFTL